MSVETSHPEKLRVIIVGGGVAALETALALKDLASEQTDVTVLAPNTEFVYRPMTVGEPFAYGAARRYPLEPIVRDAGAKPPRRRAGLGRSRQADDPHEGR